MSAWNHIHSHYESQDWSKIPSLFSQEARKYFPQGGKLLEIGAGLGQDSRYFHSYGYDVLSTDFSKEVCDRNREKSAHEVEHGGYDTSFLDVLRDLPSISDEEFDIIYAHLSLHYFKKLDTQIIASEIKRILKKDGIVAILLNSKDDPEYGTGTLIEDDLFLISGIQKRFFSSETVFTCFSPFFETIIVDNRGETYKDQAKGIHNLIRYIGKKI